MAFKIEELKSEMNKLHGLMQPNLFGLRINFIGEGGVVSSPTASLLCSAVTLPGVSFNVTNVTRQGYGPLERRASSVLFPAISSTFMLDNSGVILEFFAKWAKMITSFAHQQGEQSQDPDTGGYIGETGFYDDYISTINITTYTPHKSKIVVYTLHEAYPAVIGDVSLGWQQNDEIATLQVQFNYRYWTSTVFSRGEAPSDAADLNLYQFANKFDGAVGISKGFNRPRDVNDALHAINRGETLLGIFNLR